MKRYAQAGADGFFLPAISDAEHIKSVVREVVLPLNVMARPGLANAAVLGTLGVRRLSAGSGVSQAVWGKAQTLVREFLQSGRSGPLSEGAMAYSQLQGLFP
jgi:2-methylisocitrate lyase-like PEP mutase family enzyme